MSPNAPTFVVRVRHSLRVLLFLGKLLAFFFLLHALVFALFDLLPGAEFLQSGWAGVDPALLASTRERLGLNGSWLERYWSSLTHLLHGDLGRSVTGDYPVFELFASRIWNSVPQWLGAVALCMLAIPLGMAFCTLRIGLPHRVLLFTSHALLIPQFMAAMALFAFYISAVSPWIPQNLDGVARGCFAVFSAALLPAGMLFIAAANSARSYARETFATTYLAMGMTWTQIRWRLLRNVLIAMRPLIGRVLLAVVTGTLFAELTFSINGVGKLFVDSLKSSDWPTMQAWVLFVGAIILTVSLVERKPV
jgi:peptide/nickel transport system permease protein